MGKQEEGGPEVGKGEKEGILEVTNKGYLLQFFFLNIIPS